MNDPITPEFSEDERKASVRLTLISGIGPRIRRNLLTTFGSASEVFRADVFALRQVPEVGGKLISAILEAPEKIDVEKEFEICRKEGIRILLDSDPEYPRILNEISDAPGVLFVKGTLRACDNVSLAVIGTRHASMYGERQAQRLVGEFVQTGFSVVSGLARGIDGIAQQAALDYGGRTIAVLGQGLGVPVYPPENKGLAEEILKRGGAIVSEYPPRKEATQYTFPQRNRIIAGMTLGTVVIEAGFRSGTTLTAEFALEYGREVFALPGPVDSRVSIGCHRLIRQGAHLLESVEDVLEALGPIRDRFPLNSGVPEMVAAEHPAEVMLSETERVVFDAIPQSGITVDELAQRTSLPVWKIMTSLTSLEMKRLVKREAGQRIARA